MTAPAAKHRRPALSRCTCGHLGDVRGGILSTPADQLGNQHRGASGHGRCTVGDCACQKFTWLHYEMGGAA